MIMVMIIVMLLVMSPMTLPNDPSVVCLGQSGGGRFTKYPKKEGGMEKMHENDHARIANGVYALSFEIRKLLANKIRWRIMTRLAEKGTITWTEMQYDLRINPKLIQHHTNRLMEAGLIEHANPGFRLTKAGNAIMKMSIKEWIKLTKIAVRIAATAAEARKKEGERKND